MTTTRSIYPIVIVLTGCILSQAFTPNSTPNSHGFKVSKPGPGQVAAFESSDHRGSLSLFKKNTNTNSSPLFTSSLKLSAAEDSKGEEKRVSFPRKATGFGSTAIRSSVRATTGLSLTAMRTTLRTLTGVSISGSIKSMLATLPPSFRYFVQPFLILYYVPLTVLKGLIGPTPNAKRDARSTHENLVQYWKDAVQLAEDKQSNWPLHVLADGSMKYDLDDDGMNDVIVEAMEMKHKSEKNAPSSM